MIQVIAVVGPTASGKTALALELALKLDTEIVSADAMQFYRGMEIGSGAPSAEDLSRVKHHFIGSLDPGEKMSAGVYAVESRKTVEQINRKGRVAVLVGGSGLYIDALLEGLFEGPESQEDLRQKLAAEAEAAGIGTLYERLEKVDPDYAKIISPNDLRRIIRALEVFETSGQTLSALHRQHQESGSGLDARRFALEFPRAILYDRINARVDQMIESGFIEEVQTLIDRGFEEQIFRLKAIGYREIAAYIRSGNGLEEAVSSMKMETRRYAKRQLTWFRGDKNIAWIDWNTYETPVVQAEQVLSSIDSRPVHH